MFVWYDYASVVQAWSSIVQELFKQCYTHRANIVPTLIKHVTYGVLAVCKQCSSNVQASLRLCLILLEHCLHTACTPCLNTFFAAWSLLDFAWTCWIAQVCHPPPCASNDQASSMLLDFCLILIQAVIKQWSSSDQAVIKQWKNCKKIKQVCLILLDHAWFCLIIAWFCLIIGLFVVVVFLRTRCDIALARA